MQVIIWAGTFAHCSRRKGSCQAAAMQEEDTHRDNIVTAVFINRTSGCSSGDDMAVAAEQ